MTDEKITPEDRLLRLIRGQKKGSDSETKPLRPDKRPDFRQAKETAAAKKSWFEFLDASGWLGRAEKINFINKILGGLIIIILAYFIFALFVAKQEKIKTPTFDAGEGSEINQEKETAEAPPFSHYSSKIGQRELFKPLEAQEAEKQQSSSEFGEMAKNLSLIGIISGPTPQAIIEDKATQKSYFLNENDKIGDITIKAIKENSVTLEYGGEETELRL